MLAGYSEEWPNGCLVMPASKLGRLHSQIKMALEYLNNGYIEVRVAFYFFFLFTES